MKKNSKKSDSELIKEMLKEDHKAFTALYDRYVPRLYTFLQYYFGSTIQIDEVIQETFIKIWENKSLLSESCSFNAYLIQIAKNYVYNSYRSILQKEKFKRNLDEYINYKELAEIISKGIESLPPIQKEVFIMSREKGLSHQDISEQLNISKRTVEQHIYKALKHLKQISYHFEPLAISIILLFF